MTQDPFEQVMVLLGKLEAHSISYTIDRVREDTVLVHVAVPGERWEIELLGDGSVAVERFASSGDIGDEDAPAELFARYAESTNGAC